MFLGTTIGGKYPILGLLGEGGMGAVYCSIQPIVEREVAIKLVLPTGGAKRQLATERFFREAKAIAKLAHPAIVTLYDFGVEDDGTAYMVMELVRGQTLADAMAGGSLDSSELVGICLEVLEALEAAHAEELVHRDLKPENIMLLDEPSRHHSAKVLDFGLAKLAPGDTDGGRLTKTGAAFGTPLYMAPEQAIGGETDARSDLYSLGVILYEGLAGRPPFDTDQPLLLMHAHVSSPVPELPGHVAPGLADVVLRALAKPKEDRYQSAEAMAEALTAASGVGRSSSTTGEIRRISTADLTTREPVALANTLDGAPPSPASAAGPEATGPASPLALRQAAADPWSPEAAWEETAPARRSPEEPPSTQAPSAPPAPRPPLASPGMPDDTLRSVDLPPGVLGPDRSDGPPRPGTGPSGDASGDGWDASGGAVPRGPDPPPGPARPPSAADRIASGFVRRPAQTTLGGAVGEVQAVPRPPAPPAGKRRLAVGLAAAGLVALTGVLVTVALVFGGRAPEEQPVAADPVPAPPPAPPPPAEPAPAATTVSIDSDPPGVRVFLGEQFLGRTPISLVPDGAPGDRLDYRLLAETGRSESLAVTLDGTEQRHLVRFEREAAAPAASSGTRRRARRAKRAPRKPPPKSRRTGLELPDL